MIVTVLVLREVMLLVQVFDILKYTMQRVVQEEERRMESAWLRNVTPSLCNVELVLTKLMENRYSVDWRCSWRRWSPQMWYHIVWYLATNILEETVVSVFRMVQNGDRRISWDIYNEFPNYMASHLWREQFLYTL